MSDIWSDPSSISILHVCEQIGSGKTALMRRLFWAEHSQVTYVISIIISWAGSNYLYIMSYQRNVSIVLILDIWTDRSGLNSADLDQIVPERDSDLGLHYVVFRGTRV